MLKRAKELDAFVMGNDWEEEFGFLDDYCQVRYLQKTEDISFSQNKK